MMKRVVALVLLLTIATSNAVELRGSYNVTARHNLVVGDEAWANSLKQEEDAHEDYDSYSSSRRQLGFWSNFLTFLHNVTHPHPPPKPKPKNSGGGGSGGGSGSSYYTDDAVGVGGSNAQPCDISNDYGEANVQGGSSNNVNVNGQNVDCGDGVNVDGSGTTGGSYPKVSNDDPTTTSSSTGFFSSFSNGGSSGAAASTMTAFVIGLAAVGALVVGAVVYSRRRQMNGDDDGSKGRPLVKHRFESFKSYMEKKKGGTAAAAAGGLTELTPVGNGCGSDGVDFIRVEDV
mmetsp:Transcript_8876/g.13064  ORF Transcript_8876/g.13064 Transcript_8876/m.13064 type:complete len:288 (-) Transcript_8876:403-1266(-)|eukprot:CAMPEP_0196807418 /NCGR_PEP_ID=MMETSP1362-20130617/7399_1 /TAXON_ID=163516 /ORGANISM="Leptocylindrus danicus, Strain CCMP1856" /LENGTH=287 /DNA_ID=CAMNT_0042181337 /DNA_START=55 /DNA_END=918 /DNA_ORIENTATION=+